MPWPAAQPVFKTIGVKTGHGVKKASEFPDYFMGNMKEAVDFILDRPLDAHMTQVYEAFTKSKKRPFVIAIGGNSRAGKKYPGQTHSTRL
jgi:1-aminocyclopropane-1-carboxylate deaminase/D-cysteine desulfhydrase-like pyridoxal-dependent ACC family enzyme